MSSQTFQQPFDTEAKLCFATLVAPTEIQIKIDQSKKSTTDWTKSSIKFLSVCHWKDNSRFKTTAQMKSHANAARKIQGSSPGKSRFCGKNFEICRVVNGLEKVGKIWILKHRLRRVIEGWCGAPQIRQPETSHFSKFSERMRQMKVTNKVKFRLLKLCHTFQTHDKQYSIKIPKTGYKLQTVKNISRKFCWANSKLFAENKKMRNWMCIEIRTISVFKQVFIRSVFQMKPKKQSPSDIHQAF